MAAEDVEASSHGPQKARGTVIAEPCPFCTGSDVTPSVTVEGRVVMRCENCGASGPVCIDELNAVRSWNRRPATPDQDWD
ncbi:Lar family restriction alleviation protein [Bradyrhizobium sp. Arg314]